MTTRVGLAMGLQMEETMSETKSDGRTCAMCHTCGAVYKSPPPREITDEALATDLARCDYSNIYRRGYEAGRAATIDHIYALQAMARELQVHRDKLSEQVWDLAGLLESARAGESAALEEAAREMISAQEASLRESAALEQLAANDERALALMDAHATNCDIAWLMPDSRLARSVETLINRHSLENGSDTPDFILAQYLTDCLEAFDRSSRARAHHEQPIAESEEE